MDNTPGKNLGTLVFVALVVGISEILLARLSPSPQEAALILLFAIPAAVTVLFFRSPWL